YEGYILYPYRPSLKNRQRWTFGGLYPVGFDRNVGGGDSFLRTECLVRGHDDSAIDVVVRFLHLTDRGVGELKTPAADWSEVETPPFHMVHALRVGERAYQSWQEAEAREVEVGPFTIGEMRIEPRTSTFVFPRTRKLEPIRDGSGQVVGVLVREQE